MAAGEVLERVWIGVNGLLEQPVEQHVACFGVAPVESEGELVEVVGHVGHAEPVVQGSRRSSG